MKSILLSICILVFISNATSQDLEKSTYFGGNTYLKADLEEDFEIFKGILNELHAGLFWYRSKEVTDQHLQEIELSIADGMTEIDFFKLLAPFVSKIGCGHTGVRLPNSLEDLIQEQGEFIPLKLRFIKGKAFCLENHSSGKSIQIGDQITSINNISIDSLVEQMLAYQIGDGYVKTIKLRALEVDGDYDFSYYYYLLYGALPIYKIGILDSQGNSKVVQLKSLTRSEIGTKLKKKPKKKNLKSIALNFLPEHQVAILKVKLFMDWQSGIKKFQFKKELKKSMQKINSSDAAHLIIDVRDNPGGIDEYGLELFSYFHNRSITEFKKIEFKTKESKFLQYSNQSELYITAHQKINDSSFVQIDQVTLDPYEPSSPQYKGKIYLLMNGNCFSTCADFAALIKSNKVAAIIGEESGGGYYGNTSGSIIPFTLPNTKMRFWVPTSRYTTNVKPIVDFGRGTPPDYPIEPSVDDLINEIDTEFEFTLELIEKNK